MAERDRFELDLAAALRAYAEDAPTQVRPTELARHVAAAYPHGRTRVGPWRFAAISRLAWTLLLLAALLVALVGGALLVGSQQRRLPALVPPVGQVFACPLGSNPDEPGPVDQARPAHENSATAFDRRAGRLVVVTNTYEGDEVDTGQGVETWTFDVCTNTWTQMHPNREPPGFHNTQLVYDVDSDSTILVADTFLVRETAVRAYDLQADTWTEKGAAPTVDWVSLAYDPVSGLVVGAEHSDLRRMWTYDVEADTWTPISQARGPDYPVIAYDASVDRIVAYGDGAYGSPPYETWLFDIRSGAWSRSAAERPAVGGWLTAPGIVYDEAAERTVVFMRGPLTAYDASTDRWEVLAGPDAVSPTLMAYDSVNRRLVGWGSGGMGPPEGAVEALDPATGEWTVLLEASPAQPASNP